MKNIWIFILLCAALVAVSVRLMIVSNQGSEESDDSSNQAIECIMTRASVRNYKPEPVNDSIVNTVLKDSITDAFQWTKMVRGCAFAVVVCGDKTRLFDGDRENGGFWVQDCSAASENMLLAAHALGLGGVWCGIYPEEDRMARLSEILGLPSNLRPLNILSFGYPAAPVAPKDKWDPEKVSYRR